MADTTEIAWTDSTFNPWIGCTKVGTGCDNCYAEREFDHRHHRAKWGAGQERQRTSLHNWKLPLRWNAKPFYECDCGWRGDKLDEHTRACGYPEIGRIKQVRRRVFCASLADVFDNEVPAQWRVDLLRLIADTPNLDWLLLTKRIGNVQRMMAEAFSMGWPDHAGQWERWPELFKNIRLGASICNQTEADRDIPKLLAIPAAVRFISMEPLLGPVRLNLATPCDKQCDEFQNAECPGSRGLCAMQNAIDWVIVGGESGPKARPMHPQWVRDIRDQCAAAGAPFLFKQWGEWAPNWYNDTNGQKIDGSEWMDRMGKKAAGRMLDGVTHDDYPVEMPF